MNTNHYPSLELCKKLTEEGFKDTPLGWKHTGNRTEGTTCIHNEPWTYWKGRALVCPSVMELLDELPEFTTIEKEGTIYRTYKYMENQEMSFAGTLPDSLSKFWLWLKQNDLLPKK